MKSLEDFRAFYDSDLQPVLLGFEGRRKRICHTILGTVAGVLVLFAGTYAALTKMTFQPQVLLIGAVISGLLVAFVWWLTTRGFVDDFKNTVIRSIVRHCDESLQYSPKGLISQSEFLGSQIFKHRIDRYGGEDLVSGQVGKTSIRFSEVHAEYKTETRDSKGNRRTQWHTIFKGMFFIADFNKDFSGVTIVLPDVAERLFGGLGKKLQEWNMNRADLVKLEDPEFEKEFAVYGDDQVEARYILSTSLMKRIMDFKRQTGHKLHLSFVQSNVVLAVTTGKNMFEPRIFRTLLDFNLAREYLEDLQLALGIVEDLNLNTRIWTKE